MATTTATLTLSSADLTGDALSLSTTATLTKADTLTGLDQTTGVGRKTTASNSLYNLFEGSEYTAAKAHKIYIKNTSTVASEYATISIGDSGGTPEEIGRLYAGDWMFMPWSQGGTTAGSDEISVEAENGTCPYEWAIFKEGETMVART